MTRLWLRLEEGVAMLGVAVATVLAFVAVVLRYGFGYSHAGMEEIMRYSVVWSIFVGGAVALRHGRHIQVDILISHLPPRGRAICQGVAFSCGGALCLLLTYEGGLLVLHSWSIQQVSQSALQIPMAIPQSAVPVGALLMAIRFLQQAWINFALRAVGKEP